MQKSKDDAFDKIIDRMIVQLIELGKGQIDHVNYVDIAQVLQQVKKTIIEQPLMLQLFAPIKIVGCIHGHFQELIKIFDFVGFPNEYSYLFLGNYVDRGPMSFQTIMLLFLYKLRYPTTFFLLRGAHESSAMNIVYGFYDQCKNKGFIQHWKSICQVFNCMPYAAVVDQKIFCASGGISPELESVFQIQKIQKGIQTPNEGLACDLLWSDPDQNNYGFERNAQGVSVTYGRDCAERFFQATETQIIIRSRQVIQNGFELWFDKKLINIFSAPGFLKKYNNKAAIVSVSGDLTCEFYVYSSKKKHVGLPGMISN